MVAAMVGLGACVAAETPPATFTDSGWRTAAGTPVSLAEIDALRQSCVPRRTVAPIDSDQPAPNPLRDNPAYHPAGEALTNAPLTGIAAADRRVDTSTRRSAGYGADSVEDCLYAKGLVKTR